MKNTATDHTRIAFALGLERELLRPTDIQSIPPATRSYWRRQKPERYEVGLTKAQRKGLVSEVQAVERLRMARFVRRVVRAARRLGGRAERSRGMYANQAKVAYNASLYRRFSTKNSIELNGKSARS